MHDHEHGHHHEKEHCCGHDHDHGHDGLKRDILFIALSAVPVSYTHLRAHET